MIKASFKLVGATQLAGSIAQRAELGAGIASIKRTVERKVQDNRIKQYQARGAVAGEQTAWEVNAPRTIREKGHDKPMLSRRQYQYGAIVRSYRIETKRAGLRVWQVTLTNRARSNSGFNYPASLHEGWGGDGDHPGYPARPHLNWHADEARMYLQQVLSYSMRSGLGAVRRTA